jgi:prepilin-type N-terminal cleavage/methylation domain-containing protein
MVPLCRTAFLPVEHPSRRGASAKAELGVKPCDNKTTRQHDWSPVVSFRLVEISSSERGQLPGSPASVDPPNTGNRSAPRRIRRGEQRIAASRGIATVSAFQRLQRFPLTSDFRPLTSGFTLIELVVVTLIIATLAALTMTAASGVLDRAKKTQAKNDLTQIVTAINAYYTEYGKYPVTVTSTTTDAFFGTGTTPAGCTSYGTNDKLFNVLRSYTFGSDSANVAALNPRQIVFISPKVSPNSRGGIATTNNGYYDPWGTQYAVALDTTYNNALGTANPYSDTDGSAGPSPLQLGAIAYSYGRNGQIGGGAAVGPGFGSESGTAGKFKGSSDILSWQ